MAEPNFKKRRLEEDQRRGKFQSDWTTTFPGIIETSKLGSSHAYCRICNRDIKVMASGLHDVREHFKTKLHERNYQLKNGSSIKAFFTQPQQEDDKITRAEVLFANFIAQHNIAASIADHFSDLSAEMFPDSAIAKRFKCKRTKTTAIIKNCLAPSATEPVIKLCRKTPFSLMIDESNDRKTDKRLAIMVRVFEDGIGPRTRLLGMPVGTGGTSEAIFSDIDAVFSDLQIPWINCIGFASDNCNVMVGKSNSVLTRIKSKNPDVFSIGCICHLANLCAKEGIKQLTIPVDDLLIDIFYHFEHSSKRKKSYREFQLFTGVDALDILKHCQTRWLSLQKVVDRILNQYSALSSYFESHDDMEKPCRVKNIHQLLKSPLTQMTLRFLQFVLPLLTEFNKLFQTDESQIGGMMDEMDRLLRKFIVKFVEMKYVKEVKDIRLLKYAERDLQHDDHTLAVGLSNRTLLEELDISSQVRNSFFRDVRNFYVAVVKKILDKFPFENEVLKDIKILDPAFKDTVQYTAICKLANTFAPHLDQEVLKDEFEDYCLLPDECISRFDAGQKRSFSRYWLDIINLKTSTGRTRFPSLAVIVKRLLTLPHSNADCERSFSMMKKIHTDCRNRLNDDTVTAFLQCKINSNSCCLGFKASEDMLKKAKAACHYDGAEPSN